MKPIVAHLNLFECLAYVHILTKKREISESMSDEAIAISYHTKNKEHMPFYLVTMKVFIRQVENQIYFEELYGSTS